MIGFYFHAFPMIQGRQVEFRVYRGTRNDPGHMCGSLVFEPEEWKVFRIMLIGGIRAAGFARVPIEFMDGTWRKPETTH